MHYSYRTREMKLGRLPRIVLPLFVLMEAAPRLDEPFNEVVAVLLEVGDGAVLSRGQREKPIRAYRGDVVYAGSRLLTGGQAATFVYYPERASFRFTPTYAAYPAPSFLPVEKANTQFEVRFDAGRPVVQRGKIARLRQWDAPLAPPEFERRVLAAAEPRVFDQDLQKLEAALAESRDDPVLRLSRSVLLERTNRLSDALGEYQALAKTWGDAAWLKRKLSDLGSEVEAARQKELLASRPPRTYAILIGISEPQNIGPVPFADADALAFRKYLEDQHREALHVFPLIGRQATRAAIRETVRSVLEEQTGPHDTVYIFVSGHGLTERVEKSLKGFLVASDGDPAEKEAAAYPLEDLTKLVSDNLPRLRRLFFFLDVCRTGSYRESANEINSVIARRLGELRGPMLGMLSSTGVQPSLTDPNLAQGHGVFTYHLIEGLKGEADADGDRRVTSAEIFRYLSEKVQEATGGRQHPVRFGGVPETFEIAAPGFQKVWASAGPVELAFRGHMAPGLLAFPAQAAASPETRDESLPQQIARALDLENQGQQVIVRYLQGEQVEQRKEDFERAARLFRQAGELNPSLDVEARRLFCEAHSLTLEEDRQDFTTPLARLEQALHLNSDAAYVYNALGIAHLREGRLHQAAWAFRDAIRLAPSWIYPRHNLALTYQEAGAYGPASQEYRRAIELAPGYSYLHYSLGLLLHGLGEKREAESAYRKALELDDKQAEAHVALGVLRAAENKPNQAEQEYLRAMELAPNLIPARHNLGRLYMQQDRVEDAIRVWLDTLERKPNFLPTRLSLAGAYRGQGKFDDAIEQYEEVLALRPDYSGAQIALHETRGDKLASRGETEQAKEEYRKALGLALDEADRQRLRNKLR